MQRPSHDPDPTPLASPLWLLHPCRYGDRVPILSLDDVYRMPQGQERSWAYNALDCTGTAEVANTLLPRLNHATRRTYSFVRALQAPLMTMMKRGVKVDVIALNKQLKAQRTELSALVKEVNLVPKIVEVWDGRSLNSGKCPAGKSSRADGRHTWPRGVSDDDPSKACKTCGAARFLPEPFNPNSSHQTAHLFYDLLGCKVQYNKQKKVTTDDEAIERLGRLYPDLLSVTTAIAGVRDAKKQIGFLSARRTADDRYPSTFNSGAAWTGRLSSSKNPYGLGGNLQNVSEKHRVIFVADRGKKMFYADLMKAESNAVAHLAGDEAYIEAHKGDGDTHTFVSRLVWPNDLPWTGDIKKDKAIAKSMRPPWDDKPGHDYRFQAKAVQHGSNLGLTPFGIALKQHIPLAAAERAQARYFDAFPGILEWQEYKRKQVRNQETLENPLGRRVNLFGRPWDRHTQNQGLAFDPQSLVADILNTALWWTWRDCDPKLIWLLAQVHDAILGEFDIADEEEALRELVRHMTLPTPVTDIHGKTRMLTIGVEVAVGLNWGHASPDNPNGLEEVHL